ncbi:MAG: WD40/YVTN/BNR-like repeat-containing protein, partial [bacterium]
SSLVIDPSDSRVLYAGGRAGVEKSLDGGQTWTPMNEGLETLNVRTIAMSTQDPQLLYLGTNGSGLYRSTDGARTWTPIPLTLKNDVDRRLS